MVCHLNQAIQTVTLGQSEASHAYSKPCGPCEQAQSDPRPVCYSHGLPDLRCSRSIRVVFERMLSRSLSMAMAVESVPIGNSRIGGGATPRLHWATSFSGAEELLFSILTISAL